MQIVGFPMRRLNQLKLYKALIDIGVAFVTINGNSRVSIFIRRNVYGTSLKKVLVLHCMDRIENGGGLSKSRCLQRKAAI